MYLHIYVYSAHTYLRVYICIVEYIHTNFLTPVMSDSAA